MMGLSLRVKVEAFQTSTETSIVSAVHLIAMATVGSLRSG